MNSPITPTDITQHLSEWKDGDKSAFEKVASIVQIEIQRLARSYLRKEGSNHSLQTTELVNESYLRLIGQNSTDWQNRKHFFAVAAKVMRNYLVDMARKKRNQKHGGQFQMVSIENLQLSSPEKDIDLEKLDDALEILEKLNERQSKVVELKFFSGMTSEEAAEILNLSETTVNRDWLKAKAFLRAELSDEGIRSQG